MAEQITAPMTDWTGTQFRQFDKTNIDDGGLGVLEKALTDIYEPIFPYEEGYHGKQSFIDAMRDPDSPLEYQIVVAGDNLYGDPDKAVPKGFVIGFYYKDYDVGQLGYLGVDPNARTSGIGFALFKHYNYALFKAAEALGKPLEGSFIACHNPTMPVESENDTYPPLKRMNKYIGWGGQLIPFDYSIGYTRDGEVHTMNDHVLLSFPHPITGEQPAPEKGMQLASAMWDTNDVPDFRNTPQFEAMAASLGQPKFLPKVAAPVPPPPGS